MNVPKFNLLWIYKNESLGRQKKLILVSMLGHIAAVALHIQSSSNATIIELYF